jgi:RNA polymerase sigma-70 factor (ECF subfamily)
VRLGDVKDLARRARFEAVVAEVADPLRRFLARRTDEATAEDVLADTLLVCWRRLDDVPADAVLPWTYGVARLCLANAQRSARRQERLAARIAVVDPPAEAAPGPEDADDRVGEVMAAMRPEDAELLRLWAWEQLSPAEIATVLDVSPNAASIRLHRAREKFRDLLRKNDPDAGHERLRGGSGP